MFLMERFYTSNTWPEQISDFCRGSPKANAYILGIADVLLLQDWATCSTAYKKENCK